MLTVGFPAGVAWVMYGDGAMHTIARDHVAFLSNVAFERSMDADLIEDMLTAIRIEHLGVLPGGLAAATTCTAAGTGMSPEAAAAARANAPAAAAALGPAGSTTSAATDSSKTAIAVQPAAAAASLVQPLAFPQPVPLVAAGPAAPVLLPLPMPSAPTSVLLPAAPALVQPAHPQHVSLCTVPGQLPFAWQGQVGSAGGLQHAQAMVGAQGTASTEAADVDVDELLALCLGD